MDASHQPANLTRPTWEQVLDTLIDRAGIQHDHAATVTRMAVFDTIRVWLQGERERGPET